MHTRMYLWRKWILSLVSLTLYSKRFIWNQILFLSTRDLTVCLQIREKFCTDELLFQVVISLVSETDSLLITSPILLVVKRKSNRSRVAQGKEARLTSYRFCCDFRCLNSQTLDFSYNIPDAQELTESISQTIPNSF